MKHRMAIGYYLFLAKVRKLTIPVTAKNHPKYYSEQYYNKYLFVTSLQR